MNRGRFIISASALGLATGCGSGIVATRSLQPQSVSDMLAELGYTMASDRRSGEVYYASGVKPPAPTGPKAQECDNYAASKRAALDDDDCNDMPPDPTTEGAIIVALPIIGSVTAVISPPVDVNGPSPFTFYGAGGFGSPGMPGPYYSMAKFNMSKCQSATAGVIAAAWSMAQYIAANASRYSAAIANSAQAAVQRWGGTTMGISAAATFVFGVMASLTVGDWASLCIAVGLTAFTAYIAFNCIYNGIVS